VAPNLLARPTTVIFNKVTIKGAKQAVPMFVAISLKSWPVTPGPPVRG
jgi:formaldehyde-activating enzyme involved in methanogenesis